MAHSGFLVSLQRSLRRHRISSQISMPILRSSFSQFSHNAFVKLTLPIAGFTLTTTINRMRAVAGAARCLHSGACLAAGHSKWQNIKHIKAAQDRERGAKSNLLARNVLLALDKNPETDPKLNTELANLIKWARTNNIPNDVIDKTIDKQIKLRDPKNIIAFDGRGPMNIGMIIECFSLKPTHTKMMLQGVVKKYGFNLHASAADLFEHKGIVEVELAAEEIAAAQSDPDNFQLDKYIDIAIEAGAEDVTLQTDEEKQPYLEFLCGPMDLPKVQKSLSDNGLTVISRDRVYIPNVVVPVNDEFLEGLSKLTAKLDLNTDVIKYHFNIEPQS